MKNVLKGMMLCLILVLVCMVAYAGWYYYEDKAIEMAKKQYGTTDGVYFRIEQIKSNGVYIISVRDNETTRDYAWYTVDVINNTVK